MYCVRRDPDRPLWRSYPETVFCPYRYHALARINKLASLMPMRRNLACLITLRLDKCWTRHVVGIAVHSGQFVHFALLFVEIARDIHSNLRNLAARMF
jgi:hypothetical protein